MGNKSYSRIVAPSAFSIRGEKSFPEPTLSHAHAGQIFICLPNQKLRDTADRCRTQGYSPNPGFYDTIPCASCPSTMHGSAIAILWLHYSACAETLPGPSYDGASSTILCQDTASDADAPKPQLCSYNDLLPRSTIKLLRGFDNGLACLQHFCFPQYDLSPRYDIPSFSHYLDNTHQSDTTFLQ